MLKNILKLNGVVALDKKQQNAVSGGFFGEGNCPTFCNSSEDCLTDDCGFSNAICVNSSVGGICFFV